MDCKDLKVQSKHVRGRRFCFEQERLHLTGKGGSTATLEWTVTEEGPMCDTQRHAHRAKVTESAI